MDHFQKNERHQKYKKKNIYYFSTTEEITLRLKYKEKEIQYLKGRNITVNNLYGSITLAIKMLQRKMTLVSTMRHNRVGIPKEVKSMEGREPFTSEIWWEKEKQQITMTSYVVNTKSKGKKNVIVLSTMPPLLRITKDDGKNRPGLLKFYDFSKGGTDIVDQRSVGKERKQLEHM